jgi:hypothetical protein
MVKSRGPVLTGGVAVGVWVGKGVSVGGSGVSEAVGDAEGAAVPGIGSGTYVGVAVASTGTSGDGRGVVSSDGGVSEASGVGVGILQARFPATSPVSATSITMQRRFISPYLF